MSPIERALWLRLQRRAGALTPEMAAALLRAFEIIRRSFAPAELARLIAAGQFEQLYRDALSDAVLNRAFLSARERLRRQTQEHVKYFARDLPGGGLVGGEIAVTFNVLNPRVIDAIRRLDTRVFETLKSVVREAVRAHVEQGLREGLNPRTIARGMRDVVGLTPYQERVIRNFRSSLTEPGRSPLDYRLRDRRFDRMIAAGKMTPERIERAVNAYRRRMIAFTAETHAHTATLDALKLGQRLTWQDAIDKGIVDRDRLMKRWVGVKDDRERPEHLAMEGEVAAFDQTFSNGETIPGESTYNCRCIAIYFQRQRLRVAA